MRGKCEKVVSEGFNNAIIDTPTLEGRTSKGKRVCWNNSVRLYSYGRDDEPKKRGNWKAIEFFVVIYCG